MAAAVLFGLLTPRLTASSRRVHHREERSFEMPLPSKGLRVDAGRNGGVGIRGEDRSNVLVTAHIDAWADSEEEARKVAAAVNVGPPRPGEVLEATGSEFGEDGGWSVSYRIHTPRHADLDLRTHNGGVSIRDVSGELRFEVRNGGVDLDGVGGDVQGSTVNGGVSVKLAGDSWDGERLDASTRNGGVDLQVPPGYNAELTTGTVNGRVRLDFPISVEGGLSRSFTARLGRGGAPVKVTTTNGGVRVGRL